MIARLKAAYSRLPKDARDIMLAAAMMPPLMLSYMLMPTQDAARAAFSLAICIVTYRVGCLIWRRRGEDDWIGYLVECTAVSLCVAALALLIVLRALAVPDEIVTAVWRSLNALQQGWMVLAWALLAYLRRRWLAHSSAAIATYTSAAGLVWFCALNFTLPDPLREPAQWGVDLARSLGGRFGLGTAWVDPTLGAVLLAWLALLWLRWEQRNGPVG